jgi:phage terminase large subunit
MSEQNSIIEIDWEEMFDIYHDDPVAFCEDILEFYPDHWQKEGMLSVRDNPKTSIRSGQGVGKTAFTSCIIIWYIAMHYHARIIATSPTMQQLYDVLWAEIAKWLIGTILEGQIIWKKTRVVMAGYESTWFATAKTATRPENMQGYHEQYMLFVVDEASGVEDKILEAILGTLGHKDNRLLLLGNPTKNTGVFHESYTKDRKYFNCMKVNALDVERTNKENIQMLIDKYGADSNVVRVRVYGEPPTQEDDVFIPLSLIEQATMTEPDTGELETVDLGVDVARFGDDETVIAPKFNNEIKELLIRHGQDLMKTVSDILIFCRKIQDKLKYKGKIVIKIDDTGLGGGVTDRLIQIKKEEKLDWMVIIPVNFSRSIKHKYYDDITTYLWSVVRELLGFKEEEENTECEIVLPNDNELIAQLSIRKYALTSKGKIKLESKKEMKKRGIKSPDRADAVALACLPVTFNNKKGRPSLYGGEK